MKTIQSINNELKSYINEAIGISNKCKNKLLKLVEKYFYVELPKENYLHIDISLKENGNIIMREVEYQTKEEPSNYEELLKRYELFQNDVEKLLENNSTDFDAKRRNNEISNLLIVTLVFLIALLIGIYSIQTLLRGDLFGFFWIVIIIGYYILPASGNRLRNRIERAKRFIKSIIEK